MAVACPRPTSNLFMRAHMTELPEMANASTAWFALNTRARYEDFVGKQAAGKGYEVFLPTVKSRRKWSDRVKEIELPLFPGYLFCRFDVCDRLPLLMIPGVIQIVGAGKTPLPIADEEMAGLQTVIQNDVKREPWPFLKIGQKVRVKSGPLCGMDGLLLNVKGTHRLVLSVTLLQRSVAVEIDAESVALAPTKSSDGVNPRLGMSFNQVADQLTYGG